MGTSGSFGGSDTASWARVADYLANPNNAPGASDSGGDGQDETNVEADDPTSAQPTLAATTATLAALIAQALQDDDPAIKPSRAPRSAPGDSGLWYGRLVGRPRSTGTSKPPPTSGRRQIAVGAGRAGRAVGAGYALASGDTAALEQYGLDLVSLQGLDRYSQIFAILEAVDVGGAGPDDVALRNALVEALDRVLDTDAESPSPEATLRELVGTYAVHLLSVELDALIQHGSIPEEQIRAHRAELDDYVRVRAERLDTEGISLNTPKHFEHAAQELLRATLGLIAGGPRS